jgi:hypothetical protein
VSRELELLSSGGNGDLGRVSDRGDAPVLDHDRLIRLRRSSGPVHDLDPDKSHDGSLHAHELASFLGELRRRLRVQRASDENDGKGTKCFPQGFSS